MKVCRSIATMCNYVSGTENSEFCFALAFAVPLGFSSGNVEGLALGRRKSTTLKMPLLNCIVHKACKFDFEDGIGGWLRTGTVFNNQPTYSDNPTACNRGQPASQQADWWIGGTEDRPSPDIPGGQMQGDGPQGTLTSPSFNIKGNSISFLLGGGCDINVVRAELIISSQVSVGLSTSCT